MSAGGTTFDHVGKALVDFEDALSVDPPADMASFSQARRILMKVVNGYVISEGECLSGLTAEQRAIDEKAALYKALTTFKAQYSLHVAKWSSADASKDWTAYRSASVSLIIGMRKLLRERASIMTRYAA